MPDSETRTTFSKGRLGVGGSVTVLLIIYGFGLTTDTWVIVFKEKEGMWNRIANVGLFKACGFNTSLQLPSNVRRHACFSLLEAGVPDWIRAAQFFAVLNAVLLIVLDMVWIIASCFGSFTDKPFRYPIMIMWIATGILLMVHPIIFACSIRPSNVVINERLGLSYTTLYWVGFILHCLVAGVMNFLSLLGLCCYCMISRCD